MKQKKLFAVYSLILSFNFSLCSQSTPQFHAACQEITPEILSRMVYTWNKQSPVPLSELRYITLSHYNFEKEVMQGELVVHKLVVDDLLYIFEKLFEVQFPIHSMKLVDEFEGSDDRSMSANNSSAFYARKVANTDRWSNHSFGCALDINPLLNPYSKESFFCPLEGEHYLDRTLNQPGMITKNSYIYRLFIERGWQWGGECFYVRDGAIDRHHFQKIIPELNRNTN